MREQGRRAERREGRGQGRGQGRKGARQKEGKDCLAAFLPCLPALLPSRLPALFLTVAALLLLFPASSYAQGSPWENAVNVLMVSFTGPIARGLSLVSIVVGGVTFAFGEGGSKRLLAGIVFGVGMAIGAVNFMTWLFP
jgi:type IV secretory pathway VirB2 component (pilin)